MLRGCAAVCFTWIILWVRTLCYDCGGHLYMGLLRPYDKVWRHLCLDRMSFWLCRGRKVKKFRTADNLCACIEGREWEMPTSTAISMAGRKVVPINHNLFHFLHLLSHPFPIRSNFSLSKFLPGALYKIRTSENNAYHFNTNCLWCWVN